MKKTKRKKERREPKPKRDLIMFADDYGPDRKILFDSLRRMLPLYDLRGHTQLSTLVETLLIVRPRMLILDRKFSDGQRKKHPDAEDATLLAISIREKCPELAKMPILIYSRLTSTAGAAGFSDKNKGIGIWSRPKDVDHSLLVDHIQEILKQWPKEP